MARVSKNARIGSGTHKFIHAEDGGEIKMLSIFQNGRMRHLAECEKCKRRERRPGDFDLADN